MPDSMQEIMDKARKAYHDEMAAVKQYEQQELYKLQGYKMEAEKHLKDEINRRHANINNKVNTAKRTAIDNQNKVAEDIMRGFQRNKSANANIPRESTNPTYVPHRETPRQTREEPYMPPPRGAPYTPTPRKAPHIPHSKTNMDFKEEYETTEPGYFYRVLGLAPGSSQEVVRKAYRDKTRIYHPDKKFTVNYSEHNATYMWKVIQKANEILGKEHNSELKEKYDKHGNANGWISTVTDTTDGIAGAFKNECCHLGEYNPYRVMP